MIESEYIRKAIGANLRKAREGRQINQAHAASFIGVSETQYQKIETGEHGITADRLSVIGKHLGVTIADLLDGVDDKGEELANHLQRSKLKMANHKLIDETEDIATLRIVNLILERHEARKRDRS